MVVKGPQDAGQYPRAMLGAMCFLQQRPQLAIGLPEFRHQFGRDLSNGLRFTGQLFQIIPIDNMAAAGPFPGTEHLFPPTSKADIGHPQPSFRIQPGPPFGQRILRPFHLSDGAGEWDVCA